MDYTIIKCTHCNADVGAPCVYHSTAGAFGPPNTTSAETRMKMEREGLPLPNGRVHDSRKYWVDRMALQRRVTTVGELREALSDLPENSLVWVQVSGTGYGGMTHCDPLVFVDLACDDGIMISGDRDNLIGAPR